MTRVETRRAEDDETTSVSGRQRTRDGTATATTRVTEVLREGCKVRRGEKRRVQTERMGRFPALDAEWVYPTHQRNSATVQVRRYALCARTSNVWTSFQLPPTPTSISPFPIATRQSSTNCPRTMFALARRQRQRQGQSVQILSQTPHAVRMIRYAIHGSRLRFRLWRKHSLRAGADDYRLVGDGKQGMERFACYGTDKAGSRYGPAMMGSRLRERVLGDGRVTSQPRTRKRMGKGKGG